MTTFETYYQRHALLRMIYNNAKEKNSDEGMRIARENHAALTAEIEAQGKSYAKVYRLYEEARDRGNEYIDIKEANEYTDEAKLIEMLRECGIERFTFSSTWSSAVKSAWEFTQNGCTLEGITEINSQYKAFMSDEYEKAPAYVFKIN